VVINPESFPIARLAGKGMEFDGLEELTLNSTDEMRCVRHQICFAPASEFLQIDSIRGLKILRRLSALFIARRLRRLMQRCEYNGIGRPASVAQWAVTESAAMDNDHYINHLKQMIFHLHGADSKHVYSAPVKSEIEGASVWRGGIVEVFETDQSPGSKTRLCMAAFLGGRKKMTKGMSPCSKSSRLCRQKPRSKR